MNKRRLAAGHCLYSDVKPKRGVSTSSIRRSSRLFIHSLHHIWRGLYSNHRILQDWCEDLQPQTHFHRHLNSSEIAIKYPFTLKPCLTRGAPSARSGPKSSTRLAGRVRVNVFMKMILQQWRIKPMSCRPPPRPQLGIALRS